MHDQGLCPHRYPCLVHRGVQPLPIPLGFEGLRESFDFKLREDDFPLDRVGEQLNAALPPDIRVLDAAAAVMKPEAIRWADYRITLHEPAGGETLAADWERLRPLVTQLGCQVEGESLTLDLRLPGGGAMNLNPNLLLGALWADRGGEAEYTQVVRTAILTGELAPFA